MLRVSDKELNSPEASIILKPNPKYCRLGFAVSQQGDELVLSRYIGRDDLLLFLGKDQPSYSYEEAVFSTPDTQKMAAIVRRLTDHYPKDVPVLLFRSLKTYTMNSVMIKTCPTMVRSISINSMQVGKSVK